MPRPTAGPPPASPPACPSACAPAGAAPGSRCSHGGQAGGAGQAAGGEEGQPYLGGEQPCPEGWGGVPMCALLVLCAWPSGHAAAPLILLWLSSYRIMAWILTAASLFLVISFRHARILHHAHHRRRRHRQALSYSEVIQARLSTHRHSLPTTTIPPLCAAQLVGSAPPYISPALSPEREVEPGPMAPIHGLDLEGSPRLHGPSLGPQPPQPLDSVTGQRGPHVLLDDGGGPAPHGVPLHLLPHLVREVPPHLQPTRKLGGSAVRAPRATASGRRTTNSDKDAASSCICLWGHTTPSCLPHHPIIHARLTMRWILIADATLSRCSRMAATLARSRLPRKRLCSRIATV